MNFTKLAGTTGLFLMTIVGTGSLCNRFTIWNLRFFIFYLKFFVVFQTPFQGTKMEFSLTVYQSLFQFFWLLNHPGRIFFAHTVQDTHHLFHIRFIHRLNGTGIFRVRIFDKIEFVVTILTVQRITGFHVFQFHGSTDITGLQFFHLDTVTTGYHIDLRDTFLWTTVGIQQIVSLMNFTAHYFKIGNFTDMRFHTCLEEIKRFRSIGVRSHFFTFRILYLRHFRYKRNNVTQEFHQTANAHIFTSTDAKYREHTSGDQSLTDAFTHFVFWQGILLEEFLHQIFIILGSSFYQCFVHLHSLIHFFCRNIFDSRSPSFGFPRIFLHQQHVNQCIKARTGSYWILDRNNLRAISFFQLFEDIIIIAFFIIKLVD